MRTRVGGTAGAISVYPELCIHQLFEEQVQRTPDAIAIIDGNRALTYLELDERTNQIARFLQGEGVAPETVTGCFLLGRSSAIVEYMLAILKAGGMYLLLDPQLPASRIGYMVDNFEPVLVVADAPLPRSVQGRAAKVLPTRLIEQRSSELATSSVTAPVHLENGAYIVFTSGSTGRPKGVTIVHRALTNHSYAFKALFDLSPSDRIPLLAPVAFDVAIEEIIPALLSGCILVVSGSSHTDMAAFHQEIVQRRYSILNLPTPLWHEWTDHLRRSGLSVPSCLRLVIVGGDKIHTKHFRQWKALTGADSVHWVAAYGTSETTVTSSFYMTAWEDDLTNEPTVPIGLPIANTSLHILDDAGRQVVDEQPGELYIGGDGLARGYHNLPDRTRQSFVPDPFARQPGARLYKTGDLARFRPDGNVVWLGRRDSQVKRKNLRIDLGEIEAVLGEHQLVREAVVVLSETNEREDGKRLVAFVVTEADTRCTARELQSHVTTHVHPYMVPERYEFVTRLPLSPNGKIDRKALKHEAAAGSQR